MSESKGLLPQLAHNAYTTFIAKLRMALGLWVNEGEGRESGDEGVLCVREQGPATTAGSQRIHHLHCQGESGTWLVDEGG